MLILAFQIVQRCLHNVEVEMSRLFLRYRQISRIGPPVRLGLNLFCSAADRFYPVCGVQRSSWFRHVELGLIESFVFLEHRVLLNPTTHLKHIARELGSYTIYTQLKCRIYTTLVLHTKNRNDRMIKVTKSGVNKYHYLLNPNESTENR